MIYFSLNDSLIAIIELVNSKYEKCNVPPTVRIALIQLSSLQYLPSKLLAKFLSRNCSNINAILSLLLLYRVKMNLFRCCFRVISVFLTAKARENNIQNDHFIYNQ